MGRGGGGGTAARCEDVSVQVMLLLLLLLLPKEGLAEDTAAKVLIGCLAGGTAARGLLFSISALLAACRFDFLSFFSIRRVDRFTPLCSRNPGEQATTNSMKGGQVS